MGRIRSCAAHRSPVSALVCWRSLRSRGGRVAGLCTRPVREGCARRGQQPSSWVTRKGAIKAVRGDLGVIPGSMGTRTYIVSGKGSAASHDSCSHGAGRRMSRTLARKELTAESLTAAMAGPHVERRPRRAAGRRAPRSVQGRRSGDGRPAGPRHGRTHIAADLQLQRLSRRHRLTALVWTCVSGRVTARRPRPCARGGRCALRPYRLRSSAG